MAGVGRRRRHRTAGRARESLRRGDGRAGRDGCRLGVQRIAIVSDDSLTPRLTELRVLRRLGEEWELKRLIVTAGARRRGVGTALTETVVDLARRAGARRVILQSGRMQPESLRVYAAAGFTPIPVYEPYIETMPRSLCFDQSGPEPRSP